MTKMDAMKWSRRPYSVVAARGRSACSVWGQAAAYLIHGEPVARREAALQQNAQLQGALPHRLLVRHRHPLPQAQPDSLPIRIPPSLMLYASQSLQYTLPLHCAHAEDGA